MFAGGAAGFIDPDGPSAAQIEAEASMGLDPFGGAGRLIEIPTIGDPFDIPAGGGTKFEMFPRDTGDRIVGKDPATGSNIYAMTKNDDGTYSSSGGKGCGGRLSRRRRRG